MYTLIERRTINPAKADETAARGQREFFPKMQKAPGFNSFYLIPDTEQGVFTAIIVWESKEQAEAFAPEAESWGKVLDADGHTHLSFNGGETAIQVEPAK